MRDFGDPLIRTVFDGFDLDIQLHLVVFSVSLWIGKLGLQVDWVSEGRGFSLVKWVSRCCSRVCRVVSCGVVGSCGRVASFCFGRVRCCWPFGLCPCVRVL